MTPISLSAKAQKQLTSEMGMSDGFDCATFSVKRFWSAEKKASKDPRQAYGAMADHDDELVHAFRDLP